MIRVLATYQREMQNVGMTHLTKGQNNAFPIQSYWFVIQHYLSYGYYAERESIYVSQASGKVNWGRTIKKEKPVI